MTVLVQKAKTVILKMSSALMLLDLELHNHIMNYLTTFVVCFFFLVGWLSLPLTVI